MAWHDKDFATNLLMRFLAVEGITGEEAAIAEEITRALQEVGVPPKAIRLDQAKDRIPVPTQTGNLIVTLPGTQKSSRLLFSTHMDTVPLCAGAVPVRAGKDRIKPQGQTALGGDNRTGVACLVNLVATLLKNKLPHPPITLLFTVREESGLHGARHLDPKDLGEVSMCFNVDGQSPSEITIGAVGAERWEVEITGRASHAGVHPEQGISATLVASVALAEIHREGWFGKIQKELGGGGEAEPSRGSPVQEGGKGSREGTSNVGIFAGRTGQAAGNATNVVTDYVYIKGEARSHDSRFVKEITRAYRNAFTWAAQQVPDHKGRKAKVKFSSNLEYHPFRLKDNTPVIQHAQAAAERLGMNPTLRVANGGLDANWLVRHKIPTITFGAGQHNIHTIEEFVDLREFHAGCEMALSLATLE